MFATVRKLISSGGPAVAVGRRVPPVQWNHGLLGSRRNHGLLGSRRSVATAPADPGPTCGGGDEAADRGRVPVVQRCVGARCRPPRVTLIEGQGSGPTLCAAVRRILKAAGVPVEWDRHTLRVELDPRTGRPTVNANLLRSAQETGVVLRGPNTGSAQDGSHGSAALTLHKALGASVGVKLFSSIGGHQPYGRVRIVNIRDNVSGEYSEIEHTVVPGVVQSIKTVRRSHSLDVARFAFEYAVTHGHHRVTALHKANVMRMSDGMFLRACRQVSDEYPDVEYCEEKLDTFCLLVTEDPRRYDVLLTPSLYGSLASAACGVLAGGVATVPSVAYGPRAVVFATMGDSLTGCEHYRYGSGGDRWNALQDAAPRLLSDRGPNDFERYPAANPTGLIRAAAWMLDHMGMAHVGLRVDAALQDTVLQGVRTRDMGGTVTCAQFTDAVIRNMLRGGGRSCPAA